MTRTRRKTIADLWSSEYNRKDFANPRFFSKATRAEIFEIHHEAGGKMLPGLDGDGLSEYLQNVKDRNPSSVRFRMIFIPEVDGDAERLQITPTCLQNLLSTFDVSPRFAVFLSQQQPPGHGVRDDKTNHQIWWSAVSRSLAEVDAAVDPCRGILNWSRFCVWAGNDLLRGQTTVITWRCQDEVKCSVAAMFDTPENAALLVAYPLHIHAFFFEKMVTRTLDFVRDLSDRLYAWELKTNSGSAAKDFTLRSQAFLSIARKITQTQTDYGVLSQALELLMNESVWIRSVMDDGEGNHPGMVGWTDAGDSIDGIFTYFQHHVRMARTYCQLYEERSKIGINEGFAMVNQRDSDVNIKVAAETAKIARDTREDGQSLRIIQILSMLFLPPSLISGIFGMEFFNNNSGKFSASNNWWLYLAIAIPFTALTVMFLGGWRAWKRWRSVHWGYSESISSKAASFA